MARRITTVLSVLLAVIGQAADLTTAATTWATTPDGVSRHDAHLYRRRVFANLAREAAAREVPMGRGLWNVAAHLALAERPRNVRAAGVTAAEAVRAFVAIAEADGRTPASLNALAALEHHNALASRAAATFARARVEREELEDALATA